MEKLELIFHPMQINKGEINMKKIVALIETSNKYVFIFLSGKYEGQNAYSADKNKYDLDHMKEIAKTLNFEISDKMKIYNSI